jgi:hypothetical protein
MAYRFDDFTADCHAILTQDPGAAGREQVGGKLQALLREDAFIARTCGADEATGATVLYQDPALGFQVLAHIMNNPHEGGPHDHGASWAIYGQAVGHTDMTEWRRLDDGSVDGKADIEIARTYRLERGEAGIFEEGQIHSIGYPGGARFIRITGCDLSTIPRGRYDPDSGTMEVNRRGAFQGSD